MDKEELIQSLNWIKNPFNLGLTSKNKVEWNKETFDKFAKALRYGNTLLAYTGEIGIGKTSFLIGLKERFKTDKSVSDELLIEDKKIKHLLIYWAEPEIDIIKKHLTTCCGLKRYLPGIKDQDFFIQNLQPTLIIFDESQDMLSRDSPIITNYIRPLTDQCDNAKIVLMGVPRLKDQIIAGSIRSRSGEIFFPKPSKNDIYRILEDRLLEVMKEIPENWKYLIDSLSDGNNPRNALMIADLFLLDLAEKGKTEFDKTDVNLFLRKNKVENIQLPTTQREERKIEKELSKGVDLSNVSKTLKSLTRGEKDILDEIIKGKNLYSQLIQEFKKGKLMNALKGLEDKNIIIRKKLKSDKRAKVYRLEPSFERKIIAK